MEDLVNLQERRIMLINQLENNSFNNNFEINFYPTQDSKETKVLKQNNLIDKIIMEKEKIGKEVNELQKNKNQIENEISELSKTRKNTKEKMMLLQKQKEDLTYFKLKAEKNKRLCKSDTDFINKYISMESKQLIDYIKKLSKKHIGFTEKDKLIYNQLNDIENKQTDFKTKVNEIGDGCEHANIFIETCEKKIENLTENQFSKFKKYFLETFRLFEPKFIVQTNLIQNETQSK